MKDPENITDEISRRNFTKSAAASLIAVPLAASLANAHEDEEARRINPQDSKAAQQSRDETVKSQHDLPPPVMFIRGSLIFEREGEFANSEIFEEGGRKKHIMRPEPTFTRRVPAHIKIIDGNGETLYWNPKGDNCVITFLLEKRSGESATVNAYGGPNFVIDTDRDKELEKSGDNDKPTSKKRNKRYRHKVPGIEQHDLKALKITEGGERQYNLVLENLSSKGNELRVMIWVESKRG